MHKTSVPPRHLLSACLLAMPLVACLKWLPAPTPMESLRAPPPTGAARCLVVFLPGFGDHAIAFQEEKFFQMMANRHLSVDAIAADATAGYYFRGTFTSRLEQDVLTPSLAARYQQVWLIGPSMGGMGTLLFARTGHIPITGVLALSPYLGEGKVTSQIHAAGSLSQWAAPARAEVVTEDNYQIELWRWLQALAAGRESGPRLYVGYGRQERLSDDDSLLAAALPKDQVFVTDGEHDWKTWRTILSAFLDNSSFVRDCQ